MSTLAERRRPAPFGWWARAANLMTVVAGMARVARCQPTLGRWYVGNRLRRLTLGLDTWRGDGRSALPRTIDIYPTPPRHGETAARKEMLPLAVACRLADAVASSHTLINITGDEPCSWGDNLFLFLDYCRERGVPTCLVTAGWSLARHLDRLRQSPPTVLMVSLLGPDALHDRLSGRAVFADLDGALRALQMDRARPLVLTRTPLWPENIGVLPETLEVARRWGAAAALLHPLGWGHGIPAGPAALPPGAVRAAAREILGHAARLRLPVIFHPRPSRSPEGGRMRHPQCPYLVSRVRSDGTLAPCHRHTTGNLHEQEFPRIWNGEAMREFRKALRAAGVFPECHQCAHQWRDG